jgi:hypothetical protein
MTTQLPKQRRQFLCTECGSTECIGTIDVEYPPCAECNYLGFASDDGYIKEDLEAYGKAEYARAIDDAIELVAFHGGTVHLEAHIRQLKTK